MSIVKQIPNAITCLNIIAGCFSLVFAANNEFIWSSYCILIAAMFDFLDGFTARLLNVQSEIGKQLDSLADMVTFGVAPGLLLYHFLTAITEVKLKFTADFSALTPPFTKSLSVMDDFFPYIAFLIPVFTALRLAKFNLDAEQQNEFKGLASPGNALFIAGSLLYLTPVLHALKNSLTELGINENSVDPNIFDLMSCCIGIGCLIMASLMVVPVRMFSFKFTSMNWKNNKIRYTFIGLAIVIFIWAFLTENIFVSVPIIILLYLLLSVIKNLFIKRDEV